ncbi:WD40 repeat domain-containing protein [Jidongwangia harbinensis]|uniref:WD40 repeat domain-containing protein n=1 Tax=Jidongwangia harbinensis TaxID=2878561 RepID=UPI001CD999EA|nr:WD40 repeat domain-containing protein [Jidongwangia harbinensis]MCA2212329.1 WD40 repeat domain-containing protein [Jidongwangia harbinensis]
MTTTATPIERSRSAVRSWVRAAGSGLRKATPYSIVALLAASAVAPVAGVALGATAEYTAALGQLGGMGSNYLSDALMSAADRLRGTSATTEDEWREAVAAELLARLETGDTGLRDEIAALLHAVGAVDVALREADERTRRELAEAFGVLDTLAQDANRSLAAIGQQLAEQGRAQRVQTDLIRQSLVVTARIQQDLMGRLAADPPRPVPPPGDADATPYPGLASFDATDARYFRGREALVAELLGRLSEQLVGGPPLVVVGVSGVGKSSLLRAGVWPAVANNGLGDEVGGWPWLVMTPGKTPLAEYRGRVEALGTDRFVVLVDQFEELFTQCADPAERAAFVEALAAARPALLIIAVRADFYPQCTELAPMVPMLGAGQVVVGPLGSDDLRRAIHEPAAEAGLTVQPGLAELLLADLGAPDYPPGALPLLAHALRATWERREDTTLTVDGYRRTGGIRRAVAETAERIHLDLDEAGRVALRAALLSLVTVADGIPVRRRSTPEETDLAVLRPMIEARLVTAGHDTVEISHEALLTGWPRLASWLVEAREEILLRQRLGQAAAEWSAAGEDPDAVYRGARLAAAREWAAGRGDVPEVQRRFLAASEAAAQAQELAQRRTNRRLRRLVAGLAVTLLLAVASGVVVWRQRVQADLDGRVATSRQLAAEARNEHWTLPDLSARKSLAAWESAHTREARNALLYAQHTVVSGQLGTESGAHTVAVSPDARLIAVGYTDRRVQLWDSTTQELIAELRHPTEKRGGTGPDAGKPALLFSLSFSPDGRFLAAGALAQVGGVAIWDVPGGTLRRTFSGFGAVAWLPDSTAVLASRMDIKTAGSLGAWDPETGRVLAAFAIGGPDVIALAVSRDGRYLAVADSDDGEILRRSDGRRLAKLSAAVRSVGFAADGTLFSASADGPVQAWRPASSWRPVPLNDLESGDTGIYLAVAQGGTAIVGGDEPGEILALTLGGARTPVDGFPDVPSGLALSPDDRLLAVTSHFAPPRVIRLGRGQLPHPQIVGRVAFDASGQRLATGSNDPAIRVWDPRNSTLRDTITVPGGDGPLGLAYAPDGSLAASFTDGRILVFDPAHRLRRTLRIPSDLYPGDVAFSPDGSLLTVVTNYRNPDEKPAWEVQERPDPDIHVWEARTLSPRAPLKLPGHLPIAEAFTPDGRYLLVGANRSRQNGPQDGAVWRYRLPDLSLVDRRDVPGSPMTELAVSPDSALVALAHGQGAPVLRVDGLTPVRTMGKHATPLSRVAWSADGRTIATATDSDTDIIRLWDAGTGNQIAEVRSKSNQSGEMKFSPDGSILAAGANDWTVTLWHLDPDDAVRRICDMLVPASRHGGEPLPRTCR